VASNLFSVCFPDARTGYIAGYNGTILKTNDGSVQWEKQASGTLKTLYSVCFIDQDHGYAVGDNGTILTTNNGGVTWTAQASGTENPLYSVCLTLQHISYTVGYDFEKKAGIVLKLKN
jgi:photosystem II stability/assembly factor-like uncharacterized protein